MRRLLILVLVMAALALPAAAQTSFFTDKALQQVNVLTSPTPLTAAIPYGSVRVCGLPLTQQSPCLPLASITDINGNAISNAIGGNFGQLTTDATGRFTFGCTLGNNYQVQVTQSASNTPAVNYPITCPGVGSNPNFGPGGNVALKSLTSDAVQYVSGPNGNDTNDGFSRGTAKATIGGACNALPGGNATCTTGTGVIEILGGALTISSQQKIAPGVQLIFDNTSITDNVTSGYMLYHLFNGGGTAGTSAFAGCATITTNATQTGGQNIFYIEGQNVGNTIIGTCGAFRILGSASFPVGDVITFKPSADFQFTENNVMTTVVANFVIGDCVHVDSGNFQHGGFFNKMTATNIRCDSSGQAPAAGRTGAGWSFTNSNTSGASGALGFWGIKCINCDSESSGGPAVQNNEVTGATVPTAFFNFEWDDGEIDVVAGKFAFDCNNATACSHVNFVRLINVGGTMPNGPFSTTAQNNVPLNAELIFKQFNGSTSFPTAYNQNGQYTANFTLGNGNSAGFGILPSVNWGAGAPSNGLGIKGTQGAVFGLATTSTAGAWLVLDGCDFTVGGHCWYLKSQGSGSTNTGGLVFSDATGGGDALVLDGSGNVFPGATGRSLGNAAHPWNSFFLGTAATNNFAFTPAATAAARTVSIPDPGTNVNLSFNLSATSAAFATATTAGTCVQNTTAVAGAATTMAVSVSPVSTPGVGAVWSAFVSSAGNVTINECAVATSAGGTIAFNIRVIP